VEAERLASSLQAAARQEIERVKVARLDAERQEAERQEAERQEAARQAAVRQEVERIEAARLDGERQDAARQAAARQEKAAQQAGQQAARAEDEAKHEAKLRAIGKQLNEEADRREAAALALNPSSKLAPSSSSARRVRLFGRTDPNAELILYAEAWARKIELNMTFDMVREAAKQRHANPLVTVAIRSDGSVEAVTFVVSSGVADIDEAIRRIVQSQAPYSAFPPALASEYDVVEIRRSWNFDMAVRLY
jgi:outer membrane biosynthesis protein TonB